MLASIKAEMASICRS